MPYPHKTPGGGALAQLVEKVAALRGDVDALKTAMKGALADIEEICRRLDQIELDNAGPKPPEPRIPAR